ncbi:Rapid ALkalinization Factor [Corchorus olitorius]|uniref:Rapid ALkalinization Factor n=1 Tax=Corchorus olitorius TaxID=93759 RepID=A0A1R3KR01_9ROSI|nr:Rapid ALkalinization Factor [Corchorus olitorius]
MKPKWKQTFSMSLLLSVPLLILLLLPPQLRFAAAAGNSYKQCDGSMAECGEIDEEFFMESESSRRVLQARTISYGALGRNLPVCGGGVGQPYSATCLPPSSNGYNRGCSTIYRCRH